jgi:hypothetical protein
MGRLLLITLAAFLAFVSGSVVQQGDQNSPNNQLRPKDETENWKYPYLASEDKKQQLLKVLNDTKETISVAELIRTLGAPDRIDDLRKDYKPLSHSETGFLARNKDVYSYRCIWFARKESKSPGLGDSWLAAYVDKNEKTVSVIHQNWLKNDR